MQDPFPGWDRWLNEAFNSGYPFRSIKVFHPEDYPVVKAASPVTDVVYRSFADKTGQGRWMQMALDGKADQAANEYVDSFIDSVQTYMPSGGCESINEEYPTANNTKLKGIVDFDIAFIRAVAARLPNHRAVVFTAAVGNPGWDELHLLMPLVHVAAQHRAIMGYHGYHPVKDKQSGVNIDSAKKHLHLRFAGIDDYFVSKGYRLDWFIGEAGAMGVQVLDPPPGGNWGMSVVNGWGHSSVWGGDINAYISDLAQLDRLCASTRVAKEGRLLGVSIFTSRPWNDASWKHFNLKDGDAQKLGSLIGQGVEVSDYPEPPTQPPTQPPTTNPDHEHAWNVTVEMQVTGQGGLRLNAGAAIQQEISKQNEGSNLHLQIVTDEYHFNGRTYQAAESLTGACARRVYVWHPVEPMYWYEDPSGNFHSAPHINLSQRDERWAHHRLGENTGHGKTIGNWGCLLVVYNMLAIDYRLTEMNPSTYNLMMTAAGGFIGPYLQNGAFAKAHSDDIVYEGWLPRDNSRMLDKIEDYLLSGRPVPARVDFRPSTAAWEQHWVLLLTPVSTPTDSSPFYYNDYLMADPWTGEQGLLSEVYDISGVDVLEALFYKLK
jgi:hypothetical protein